jgi:hypothetical protein
MTSQKTNKRSEKKRPVKKTTHKGGDIQVFGYTCKKDEANMEEDKSLEVENMEVENMEVENMEEDNSPDTENIEEDNSIEVENNNEDNDDEEESDDEDNIGGGKKGRKARKSTKKARKSHKKNRKTMKKKGKSAWTTFVTDLYRKNKQKNPVYMFKNALKDAAKIYKK